MTYILTLGNADQVIQISDRRLTNATGVLTDSFNKGTAITCADGRFAVGFSGIAQAPGFNAQKWILDSLYDCAPPDYTIANIALRFSRKATSDFATLPSLRGLNPEDKRISVMLSGYLEREPHPLIGNIIVTNFLDAIAKKEYREAQSQFWLVRELESEGINRKHRTYLQRIGAWPAGRNEEDAELLQLLAQHKPPTAIVDKAVSLIRTMAQRPEANSTIGKDLVAAIIPSDKNQIIRSILKPFNAVDQQLSVDLAKLDSEGSTVIRGLTISAIDGRPAPPLQPALGPNERCWCKSGKKFKKCHGRRK